jgi:hypothetical protein
MPLSFLGLVALLGFEACRSRSRDHERATSSNSPGGSGGSAGANSSNRGTGGSDAEPSSAGASGEGGSAAVACPRLELEPADDAAAVRLHPPDAFEIYVLAVLDGLVYFVEGDELRRLPLAGGSFETVGPFSGSWIRLFDGDQLIWAQPGDATGTLRIVQAPLVDPSDIEVVVDETPSVSHLLVGESSVYWATIDPYDLYAAPLSGGTAELVAAGAQPMGAVVHDGYYYWIDFVTDQLERIRFGGGTREALAPVLFGGPMAAADDAIYWGDTIVGTIEKWSPKTGRVRLTTASDALQLHVADDTVFWSQGLLAGTLHSIGTDGKAERDLLCGLRPRISFLVTDDYLLIGGGSGLIRLLR